MTTAAKRQRAINWVAIIGAFGAAGGTVVESYRKGSTDDTIKLTFARELAAYHTWRDIAIQDLQMLEAENKQLRESIAGLTATVDLLAERRPSAARQAASEVRRYIEQPPPIEVMASDGMIKKTIEKSATTSLPAPSVIREMKMPSRIRASRSFDISPDKIQKRLEQLF